MQPYKKSSSFSLWHIRVTYDGTRITRAWYEEQPLALFHSDDGARTTAFFPDTEYHIVFWYLGEKGIYVDVFQKVEPIFLFSENT